jgi:hypothetical protein
MRLRSQPPEGAPANPHVEELVVRRTPTRRVPVDTPDAPRHVEPAVSAPVARKMGTAARTGVPRAPEAARPSEATDSGDVAAQAAEAARARFERMSKIARTVGPHVVEAVAQAQQVVAEAAAIEAQNEQKRKEEVKKYLPGVLVNLDRFRRTGQPATLVRTNRYVGNFGPNGLLSVVSALTGAQGLPVEAPVIQEDRLTEITLGSVDSQALGLDKPTAVKANLYNAKMEDGGFLTQIYIPAKELGREPGLANDAVLLLAQPE